MLFNPLPPPWSFSHCLSLEELRKQLPQRENNGRKFGPSSSTSMKRKFFLSRAAAIIRGGWGPIWAEKIRSLNCSPHTKTNLEFRLIIFQANQYLSFRFHHQNWFIWISCGFVSRPHIKTSMDYLILYNDWLKVFYLLFLGQ